VHDVLKAVTQRDLPSALKRKPLRPLIADFALISCALSYSQKEHAKLSTFLTDYVNHDLYADRS